MTDGDYVPALRFRALTAIYDPVVALTTREREFKRRLLEQASPSGGERVLDLGCGTGTLAIAVKGACPGAEVVGVDGDREILGQARAKAATASREINFDEGLATALPYPDQSFDLVLSTLFFHHLDGEAKRLAASEVARVLKPGGRFCVADWGRPQDQLMALVFLIVRALDGFEPTRENAAGELPSIFAAAGMEAPGRSTASAPLWGRSPFIGRSDRRLETQAPPDRPPGSGDRPLHCRRSFSYGL